MPKTEQVLERHKYGPTTHASSHCYGRIVNLYINRRVNGKLKWIKVGEYCHGCREVGLLGDFQKKEETV